MSQKLTRILSVVLWVLLIFHIKGCGRFRPEEGTLTEEEVGYHITGAIQFDTLTKSPICDDIFDISGTLELPRVTSYAQPIGNWDERTAGQIKQKEWRLLVQAVESAKGHMKVM